MGIVICLHLQIEFLIMDKQIPRTAKTNLLKSIQQAYQVAIGSNRANIPLDEYHQILLSRRKFLKNTGKASLLTVAAGSSFLAACAGKPKPIIAIIGAGIAGLNAAYTLKRAGYFADIYEASDRTGGRIFTATDLMGKGLTTEMGGEFIDSTHHDVLTLVNTFGLPLFDTHVESESKLVHATYFINNRVLTDKDILEMFYPYANQIAKDIESLSDVISYKEHTPVDVKFDNLSIAEYLSSLGISGDLYKLLDVAYTTEYGCEIDNQSAINFLMLMNPDMTDNFQYSGFSDERFKVQGGNQSITNELTKRLAAQLNLGHRLEAIYRADENSKTVLNFQTASGPKEIMADYVIITIPFTILRDVKMQCGFSDLKMRAINELGYGRNAKFFNGFSRPLWRELGYSGFSFTDTVFQNGWDNSQLQTGEGAGYTIFTGGIASDRLEKLSDNDITAQLMPVLENVFPGITALQTQKQARFQWASYPYAKASYTCFKPGQYTSLEGVQREPSGNIFFAGEHCSFEFQGFMNGAAQTGREAAEAIITAIA